MSSSWNIVKDLKPSSFWKYFYDISLIPRPSKKEERVGNYVGNVVWRIDPTKGFENVPMITLQSHQDMVCVSDKEHDFLCDPITLIRQSEDWMCADQTTLGADNGVGIAATLSIFEHALNGEFSHGPLEALFTVDEETGLNGVKNLNPDSVKGKYLINLDSEDFGEIFVGCAGGARSDVIIPIEYENERKENYSYLMEIELKQLLGGHSGVNISLERANANKFLARFIHKLLRHEPKIQFSVIDFLVDSNYNAIPATGKIILTYDTEEDRRRIEETMKQHSNEMIILYKSVGDDQFTFKITKNVTTTSINTEENEGNDEKITKGCWSEDFLKKFVRLMVALPHGVHRMSHDLEGGVVETSNNVANCYTKNEGQEVKIGLCTRSMKEIALEDHLDKIQSICELVETARFVRGVPYPGWSPVMESKLLGIVESVYSKKIQTLRKPSSGSDHQEVKVMAIHAGLECGYILKKRPEMEAVSIGPTIEFPHSTKERLHVPSTVLFCELVREILVEFTKKEDW